MRRRAAALAALLLVGCGGQNRNRNDANAANEGGRAAAPAPRDPVAEDAGSLAGNLRARILQPGDWELTSQMTSVEAPGAPPESVEQMRANLPNQRQTQRQCLTQEEAANLARNLLGRNAGSQGCEFSDTTFTGGVVRIIAACRAPDGSAAMSLSVEGEFTATRLNSVMRIEVTGPNTTGDGTQTVRMAGTMTGRRLGPCAAPGSALGNTQ
jgi:uncharacterized protein DUF3617